MNNLKKAGVMFVIATLTLTMVLVPFTPMAQIQPVAAPEYATPEDVLMDIERYVDTQKEGGPLGSILASYRDTGYISNSVSRNDAGDVGILVTVRSDSDVASLDEIIDVNWKVEIGAMTITSGFVSSPEAVTAIENFDGIVTAFADALKREVTRGVEPRDIISDAPPQTEPEAYAIIPEIGADLAWAAGYDGTGSRIGVIDTGTDFSSPDMVDAIDFGSDGLPTSYDPSGYGFGINGYRVNLTTVDPARWLATSGWNILSYTEGGKTYINTSTYQHNDGSPYVQYLGGMYDLDYFFDIYIDAWWPDGYLDDPALTANITEFYYDALRQPLEIPDPTTISGGGSMNVTLNATLGTWQMVPYASNGYSVQRRYDPSMRLFAATLVVNSTIIIVDWNTTRAWTDFWNLNINYGVYDFNDTATWAMYEAMGDWSFADDLAGGYYYTADGTGAHTNLYYVYPSDSARFGLGLLCHVADPIWGGMIDGMSSDGRYLGIMYDGDSHGTFVSAQIASRGLTQYPVGLNGAMEYLPGVAPNSTIMGVKTVGVVSEFNSMLYSAGFDLNGTSGYWEWNYASDHQMDITSNSWGWVAPQYFELAGQYSLIYAAVATPGFFNATHYPGMVICFAAGNSGPGYGTTTPPRAPQIINVGASTSSHTFNDAYGPGQGFDQIADFSSRGPLTLGYPKPDVLAPGRNNYGLVPTYGGVFGITAGTPYAVYAGTSMACPLVAGLAALVLDANSALTPDMVKTVIQSTADDTGMDGLSQGHGVINAWAAIDYVVNGNGNLFYTYDSIANWGTATAEAWQNDMNPYEIQTFINTTTPPGNFADGNLYFGLVEETDAVTISVEGDFGTYTNWDWTDAQYVVDEVTTFTFETYIYNETTSTGYDSTKGGYIVLNTAMETASTGSYGRFLSSDYATISVTGDQDVLGTRYVGPTAYDDLWAFVFNWIDNDPNNSVPDYYNTTFDTGDELTRWTYAGGTGNVLKMDLSYPGGLSNLFPNTAIVMVHDDTIWDWPYTTGNMLDVTVTTWQLVDDANIAVTEDAGEADVTLTVAAGTDYGIHQGFVIATNATNSSMVYKLPYVYNVYATYDTAGTVVEITEGIGDVQTPYEHGTVTAGWDSYYTAQSADHISFVVDLTDATVNYLSARINWTNADTELDVAIVDMTGFELAHSGDAGVKLTADSSLAVANVTGATGMYIIYTSTVALEGGVPEDFTLSVVGLVAIDDPTLALSWYSRDTPSKTVLSPGDSAAGDHVILNATWTDGVNPGMPELSITSIELKILAGGVTDETVAAVATGDPDAQLSGSVITPTEWSWVTSHAIASGEFVKITVDFDGGDGDSASWWSDTPMEERTYSNRIATHQSMASGNHPEYGTFTAGQSGSIDVGCLDYGGDSSEFHVIVDTRAGLEPDRVFAKTFEIDTYNTLFNGTYTVAVVSETGANLGYNVEYANIFLGNFFAPVVTVNTPVDLGSNVFNFTWSATDLNADDVHYYSVWLSGDGGVSYQVLSRNVTDTFFGWDSSVFLERTDYIVRIRAYSVDFTTPVALGADLFWPVNVTLSDETYWPGDHGDGFSPEFSAGGVPPTTEPPTTTSPTTTTTSTTPTETGIDPLLIGLIGGIGVGVVILLILFLIRKK